MPWNRYRRNKLGNTKVTSLCHYGYTHRSKLERAVCDLIVLREKAGELKHVSHEFRITFAPFKISYIVDFRLEKDGVPLFCEAKGLETPEFRLKLCLYRILGPGPLELWKGSWQYPRMVELVIPEKAGMEI